MVLRSLAFWLCAVIFSILSFICHAAAQATQAELIYIKAVFPYRNITGRCSLLHGGQPILFRMAWKGAVALTTSDEGMIGEVRGNTATFRYSFRGQGPRPLLVNYTYLITRVADPSRVRLRATFSHRGGGSPSCTYSVDRVVRKRGV